MATGCYTATELNDSVHLYDTDTETPDISTLDIEDLDVDVLGNIEDSRVEMLETSRGHVQIAYDDKLYQKKSLGKKDMGFHTQYWHCKNAKACKCEACLKYGYTPSNSTLLNQQHLMIRRFCSLGKIRTL